MSRSAGGCAHARPRARGSAVATSIAVVLLATAAPATTKVSAPAPGAEPTEGHARCLDHHAERQALFGDLHVHTAYSQDASTQGTRNRPVDAYRFARGEPLGIQPYDEQGRALRHLRLERPLDFAAVTDHAELLGETEICNDPTLEGHDAWVCRIYRRWPRLAFFYMNWRASGVDDRMGFCGADGARCLAAARGPWQAIQDAAEGAYDRTADCRFTSFVGYEWTGADDLYNIHRNVIFRNEKVPGRPTSFYEEKTGPDLDRALDRTCRAETPGCDFVVIPHNSNLSAGRMFATEGPSGGAWTAEDARRQAAFEPLIEVMQHKGSSECLFTGAPGQADELCDFETLPWSSFSGKFVPFLREPPSANSFVRWALAEGLKVQESIGENPYKYGFIASTDTHLGTPGAVDERSHPGHGGAGAPAGSGVPVGLPDEVQFNPGGLAVVWAEENSRESIFAALRRRETYGTSGPRMRVRFFGGWELPEDLCEQTDFVARGYSRGVPMGSDLPSPETSGAAPRFAVWASRDPGTESRPGGLLQRIQIVKGWVRDGQPMERVYDVVGDFEGLASVDPKTCEVEGPGAQQLCHVWRDPEFDPGDSAYYYARVLENPSCRWHAYVCNAAGVRCEDESTIGEGLEGCCDPVWKKTQQERAWTSPIYFTPDAVEPPLGDDSGAASPTGSR